MDEVDIESIIREREERDRISEEGLQKTDGKGCFL